MPERRPAAKRTRPKAPSKRAAKPAAGGAGRADASSPGEGELDARFNVLVRNACLRAGAAGAVATLTDRVPMLARVVPGLLEPVLGTLQVATIQQKLVHDVLDLYALQLSAPERRGVVMLATAANVGPRAISQQTVARIEQSLTGIVPLMILSRAMPVAALLSDNAAAVASTYAVGRRAQALCRLSRSDAQDLGQLFGGLTGLDQKRLVGWSGEALRLAMSPLRSALVSMLTPASGRGGRR